MNGDAGTRVRPACLLAVVVLVVLSGCPVTAGPDGVRHPLDDDRDNDGLDDATERRLGTDPADADTDGDRLLDGAEHRNESDSGAALPGADPLHKDLYVQVVYGRGVAPLDDAERNDLREIWASMDVANPDGEPGVRIHVDDDPPHGGSLDRNVTAPTFENGSEDDDGLLSAAYERHVPGDRQCVYHLGLFTDSYELGSAGRGQTPGHSTVVHTDAIDFEWYGTHPFRLRALTHELLHNVVGDLAGPDGSYSHTETGWLAHGEYRENASEYAATYERLSAPTAEKLSSEGFTARTSCRRGARWLS